jgi:hypothetical protein
MMDGSQFLWRCGSIAAGRSWTGCHHIATAWPCAVSRGRLALLWRVQQQAGGEAILTRILSAGPTMSHAVSSGPVCTRHFDAAIRSRCARGPADMVDRQAERILKQSASGSASRPTPAANARRQWDADRQRTKIRSVPPRWHSRRRCAYPSGSRSKPVGSHW